MIIDQTNGELPNLNTQYINAKYQERKQNNIVMDCTGILLASYQFRFLRENACVYYNNQVCCDNVNY